MNRNLSLSLFTVTTAFVLWASATALSRHAQIGFDKTSRARMDTSTTGEQLLGALKEYERTLKNNPNDKEALLGIARISLGVGIADKAREYFERYRTLDPNNGRVNAEYALALGQSGEIDRAVEILNDANKADPQFYVNMALAITYETAQKIDKAIEAGNAALQTASTEDEKEVANALLGRISQQKLAAEDPKGALASFFREHPVLGPKIVDISWERDNVLHVSLKDFPIEQMPPFAKQSLIAKVQGLLRVLSADASVQLTDVDTGNVLLKIPRAQQ